MKNLKKYIKVRYFISYIKFIIYKLMFRKIKFHGYKYFFGKNSKFIIDGDFNIIMKDKVYLSDRCCLNSCGGNILIGENTFFNCDCKVVAKSGICIGDNCLFGPNVGIYDHDHIYSDDNILICKQGFSKKEVKIGSNVWIGANVVITKGVSIEDRVVVGANSVVTRDLKSNGLYAGNPAMLIKKI